MQDLSSRAVYHSGDITKMSGEGILDIFPITHLIDIFMWGGYQEAKYFRFLCKIHFECKYFFVQPLNAKDEDMA